MIPKNSGLGTCWKQCACGAPHATWHVRHGTAKAGTCTACSSACSQGKLPCASGAYKPYGQCGGPIMGERVSVAAHRREHLVRVRVRVRARARVRVMGRVRVRVRVSVSVRGRGRGRGRGRLGPGLGAGLQLAFMNAALFSHSPLLAQ